MTDIEVQFIKTGKGEAFTIGPITLRVLEDGSHTDNREHFLPCVLCELSARAGLKVLAVKRWYIQSFVESFLLFVEKIYASADMPIYLETVETITI
jgi:hypothetical protein